MTTDDKGGSGSPPAGWYPDAANPARERLWTGEHWIEWIRPVKAGRVEADPAGWRPDPRRPGSERLWSGEMWTEETRAAGAAPSGWAAGSMPAAPASRPVALHYDERPPERLGMLGLLVQIALVAVIFAALAALVADVFYIRVLADYIHHHPRPVSGTEAAADAARSTYAILKIVEAVTAIAFLFWFYRAYRNLIRTGIRDVRFSTGWAVGGWFIPFFNLVRQKQIANDIWKGSLSAATVGISRWREIPLAGALNWWWGVWILGAVLVALGPDIKSDLADKTINSLDVERTGIWIVQFGLAALIVAAALAIVLVRRISRLQDDNFGAVPAWNPGDSEAGDHVAQPPG